MDMYEERARGVAKRAVNGTPRYQGWGNLDEPQRKAFITEIATALRQTAAEARREMIEKIIELEGESEIHPICGYSRCDPCRYRHELSQRLNTLKDGIN